MATAKNPGAGQGKGGGRPSRGEVVRVRVDLAPDVAAMLQGRAEAAGVPVWRVVEQLVRESEPGQEPAAVPPLVREIAQGAAGFLAEHAGKRGASGILRRAWESALVLASHGIGKRTAEGAAEV